MHPLEQHHKDSRNDVFAIPSVLLQPLVDAHIPTAIVIVGAFGSFELIHRNQGMSLYLSHIFDKKCSAGVCKNLFDYEIDENLCNGCTLCAVKCPEGAVSGVKKKPHTIDIENCVKCGICFSLCKQEAIKVV